jgi:hypothetical protein
MLELLNLLKSHRRVSVDAEQVVAFLRRISQQRLTAHTYPFRRRIADSQQ